MRTCIVAVRAFDMAKIVLVLSLQVFNVCVLATDIATYTVWKGSKDCSGQGADQFTVDVSQAVTNGCVNAQALSTSANYNVGDAISIKYVCAGGGVTKEEMYRGTDCTGSPYDSTAFSGTGISTFLGGSYGGQCAFLQTSSAVASAKLSKPLANLNNIPACALGIYTTYQGNSCSGTGTSVYRFDITQQITNNCVSGEALTTTANFNAGEAISFKYECTGSGVTTERGYRCANCACTPYSSAALSGSGVKTFLDGAYGGQCAWLKAGDNRVLSGRTNLALVNKNQLAPNCDAESKDNTSASQWNMPSLIGYLVTLTLIVVHY